MKVNYFCFFGITSQIPCIQKIISFGVGDYFKMSLQLTEKYLALFALDVVWYTGVCTVMCAQVKGQYISGFGCENETAVVFL